jgi:cytochrome c oxidase subunit 2
LPTLEPPQIHGNTRLEVMWAAVPALILVGLFGITVSRMGDMSKVSTDPNALRISVTGRQFQWEFAYGSSGVKSTDTLHLPVGQQLIFDVTSMDVIHSFWVPDLYGKIDANPGRVNHITFKAKQPGEYRGVCAELCGAGHSGMLFRVQVVPQSDFQQWLQEQQSGGAPKPAAPAPTLSPGGAPPPQPPVGVPKPPAPAPAADAATIEAGKALVTQKGCGACHMIPGIPGAAGTIGPNLAGVASRTRIAGGAVPNNGPDDLKKWIMNPPALKPGTLMPNLSLTDDEATKIVAFLETLK